jgi:hypothetical protein
MEDRDNIGPDAEPAAAVCLLPKRIRVNGDVEVEDDPAVLRVGVRVLSVPGANLLGGRCADRRANPVGHLEDDLTVYNVPGPEPARVVNGEIAVECALECGTHGRKIVVAAVSGPKGFQPALP